MKKWLFFGAYLTLLGITLFFLTSLFNFFQYKSDSVETRVLGWENYIAQNTCNITPYTCGGAMYFDSVDCVCKCPSYPTCSGNQYWDPYYCQCKNNTSCTEPSGGCGANRYWNSSSCSCMDSSVCVTPSGGCGSNSYFDSASCSCRPVTCAEPSGGCGTNYYWNSSTCSCQYSGTACTTPSGGCPSGYYFDNSSCNCKTTCVIPSGGCGTNYYWNSSTCSCVYSGSGCAEPSSGCGSNYYWDNASCMCRPTTSSCTAPSSGCGLNYYWNSSTCSCVYTGTSCVAPSYGCGSGYFWDSVSCTCKSTTTSCTPPTFGCTSGYYWDYYSCSCKPSTSFCSAPSSGCGSNYYWDPATCLCKPSTTTTTYCTQPSGGCPSGYYWDQGMCSCKAGSSTFTYCMPPTYGCGTGYYWDGGSCSCKPSTSTCYPPSTGCGTNYYWDGPSCSCRSLGTTASYCTPPSSGCSTNYYWDSVSCSCKIYSNVASSCYPPSYGCGINYFWDSYSCSCRASYSCYAPGGGCGTNYYWDGNTCSCRYAGTQPTGTAPTVCYPPSTGCGVGYLWDAANCTCSYSFANFDRLSFERTEVISCIEGFLSDSEYKTLRYLMGNTQYERDLIHSLSEKVKSCYTKPPLTTSEGVQSAQQKSSNPIESESCLKEYIGEKAYQEIYSGVRPPSYPEKYAFQKCYENKVTVNSRFLTNDEELGEEKTSCLKSVLGAKLYSSIKNGENTVPYELKQEVDKCFGVKVKPFVSSSSDYKVPDSVLSCLENTLGVETYKNIKDGKRIPTDDEKNKVKICFDNLNEIQAKFVPPPVEQVPYLQEDNTSINVTNSKQETDKKKNKILDSKIILNGKGPKNSIVTIYVFSEPIVVTTKTDENGDWVYELKDPVEGGKHVAYATVKTSKGDMRSSVFNFDVSAAEPDIKDIFVEETKAAPTVSKYTIFSLTIVGVGLVLLLGGIFVMRRTAENQENFLSIFKRLFTGYR